MTNAQVAEIVAGAAQRGIEVDSYDASVFLGAQEILEREPHNANAREVVANFTTWMQTGIKPVSFAEFELPLPDVKEN